MAISILYNPMPTTIYEADGDRASGALAYFYLARTTTPLAVYTDAPLATPHTWPVVASAYGMLPPVYVPKGTEYKVRITDSQGSLLYAADGIDNPAEPTSSGDPDEGGEDGLTITEDQLSTTGQFDWQPINAARNGWVRCNGKTISSAAGTGTERVNDDCEDLFKFFWDNFANADCPVTPSGRGANAEADWAANKAIGTLDMRGRSLAGLDTMGNTAAERIQIITTISTTNTSVNATIPTGTKVAAGMFVLAAGVPAGTKVSGVDGATVVLTVAATATAAGVAARFSHFSDAQVPGAMGGENTHTTNRYELATHFHPNTATATSTVHDDGHGHEIQSDAEGSDQVACRAVGDATFDMAGGPGAIDYRTASLQTTNDPAGITVTTTVAMSNANNTGGGMPMNIWSPTVLGTWFAKL